MHFQVCDVIDVVFFNVLIYKTVGQMYRCELALLM